MATAAERQKLRQAQISKMVVVTVPNGKGGFFTQQYREDQLPKNVELSGGGKDAGYEVDKLKTWTSKNRKEAEKTDTVDRIAELEAKLLEVTKLLEANKK